MRFISDVSRCEKNSIIVTGCHEKNLKFERNILASSFKKNILLLLMLSVDLNYATFMSVKMVKLSPLKDERMRRNKRKHEGKIKPPDSILGSPDYILARS